MRSIDRGRYVFAHPRALRIVRLALAGTLGFNNDYAVVVPTERAASLGLQAIPDLARFENGIRIAAHPVYACRPHDGLYPLLRRYSLRPAEPPLLIENAGARYEALLGNRVDVAIAFTTDGALAGRRLRMLADPLNFFPEYAAAIVVNARALNRHPGLGSSLRRLEGRIDNEAMRRLNAEVQLQGRQPIRVATDFLLRRKIVEGGQVRATSRAEFDLVHAATDRLAGATARALSAVREVFLNHAVRQRSAIDPIAEVVAGNARLAVLGAERLFTRGFDNSTDREERVEAVSVVGNRFVHVVAQRKRKDAKPPLAGKVGIVPAGSGAG